MQWSVGQLGVANVGKQARDALLNKTYQRSLGGAPKRSLCSWAEPILKHAACASGQCSTQSCNSNRQKYACLLGYARHAWGRQVLRIFMRLEKVRVVSGIASNAEVMGHAIHRTGRIEDRGHRLYAVAGIFLYLFLIFSCATVLRKKSMPWLRNAAAATLDGGGKHGNFRKQKSPKTADTTLWNLPPFSPRPASHVTP